MGAKRAAAVWLADLQLRVDLQCRGRWQRRIASEGLRLFDSLQGNANGCSARRKKKSLALVGLQYDYGCSRFTRGYDWNQNMPIYNIYRTG